MKKKNPKEILILSKNQYAYKLNINPKLFDSIKEISKFALWFKK